MHRINMRFVAFACISCLLQATSICTNSIDQLLQRFTRPMTVLAIGPTAAQYALKQARIYNTSVFVLVDGSSAILAAVEQAACNNVLLLHRVPDITNLYQLSLCEHIDVTIALDIKEQFGTCWRCLLDTLCTMGWHVVIRLAQEQAQELTSTWQHNHAWREIPDIPNGFMCEQKKEVLARKTWIKPIRSEFTVKTTYTEKKLFKITPKGQHLVVSDWSPGINLITYKMFSGAYPAKKVLKDEIERLKYVCHNDWGAHNMVIQGTTIALIDKSMRHECTGLNEKRELRAHRLCEWIDLDNQHDIEAFYFERLKVHACHGAAS